MIPEWQALESKCGKPHLNLQTGCGTGHLDSHFLAKASYMAMLEFNSFGCLILQLGESPNIFVSTFLESSYLLIVTSATLTHNQLFITFLQHISHCSRENTLHLLLCLNFLAKKNALCSET